VIHHPSVLRQLVLRRDLVSLAESHLAGELEAEGDLEQVFHLIDHAERLHLSGKEKWRIFKLAFRLPRRRAAPAQAVPEETGVRHNSRESIAHHYDVSNDFYRLWLDPEMVYSCAYFRDAGQSLADAQRDKLDYICRKLRLRPGQRLLDIGCGWGALICWGAHRAGGAGGSGHRGAAGLPGAGGGGVLRSHRQRRHVRTHRRGQLSTLKRLLRPGGLFLNHGISNDRGWEDSPATRFINRYIFPDGELTRVSRVQTAMEDAGFEILDVESLRRHYAMTLRHWVRALENHQAEAVAMAGEETYRLWRLYMAGSAYYFEQGTTNIYQVLAAPAYQRLTLPLRRDDLYR